VAHRSNVNTPTTLFLLLSHSRRRVGVYLQPDDNDRCYAVFESESEPEGKSVRTGTHGEDPVSLNIME
jgi:hypothetical protein